MKTQWWPLKKIRGNNEFHTPVLLYAIASPAATPTG